MKRALALLPFVSLVAFAQPDFQALARERQVIETRYEREQQKIDQEREKAMIPVNARVRSLEAAAERETRASFNTAAIIAGKIEDGVDTDKIAKAHFSTLEAKNLEYNKLSPEAEAPFTEKNQELDRRRTLELAIFDTKMMGDQEGAASIRAQAIKRAEIVAKWQEKIDALSREEQKERDQTNYKQTTKINEIEADIFSLNTNTKPPKLKKAQEKAMKSSTPPDFSAAVAMPPAVEAMMAKKDEAKNALATAQDEIGVKYNAKRTDIENARDDELAKVEG